MLGGTIGAVGPIGAAAGAFGGVVGGASPAFGGNVGTVPDFSSEHTGFSAQTGFETGSLLGTFFGGLPGSVIGGLIGAMSSFAQGDPNFSPGNTGPGTTGAQGGGPTVSGPVSQTSRAITQAVAPPAPVAPPPAAPLVDDRQRKRVGRQETILTSRSALSDAPTFRPTLLGQ